MTALTPEQIAHMVQTAPARRAARIDALLADPTVQAMLRAKPGDPSPKGITTTFAPLVRLP